MKVAEQIKRELEAMQAIVAKAEPIIAELKLHYAYELGFLHGQKKELENQLRRTR